MTSPELALVTGATGSIGPALVQRLLNAGFAVRTMSRGALLPAWAASGIKHISGDITDDAALEQALAGVSVVFHLAALLHIENPGPEVNEAYRRVNVDGTSQLLAQASRSCVRRFVYFSTVKVYGTRRREPVTEEFEPAPMTAYARTKLEGERIVAGASAIETVILRLSPVYGSRVKGSWGRLINAIARDRFIPVGSLNNVHSVTHVADVTLAALLVAQHPQATGNTYNLVAHETPTLREILQAIYAAHGKALPAWRIPAAAALPAAAIGGSALHLMGRRSPLPVEAIRQLVEDEAYSGLRLRQLGFSPQVPLSDGWNALD